jgi:MFS family permease
MDLRVLHANRDFRRLWAGQALSKLGSRGSVVAVPLLVLSVTHSPLAMGLVAFAETVAEILVMLPAGVLADRRDRRGILLACDAGCAGAVAALGVAVLTHHVTLPLILVVGVVDCMLGGVFISVSGAVVPRVVADSERLIDAVALIQVRNAAVYLVGPVAGGLLYGVHPALPFLADAASYGWSFLMVRGIRTTLRVPRRQGQPFLRDAVAGLRFLGGHPFLRYAMLNAAVLNAAFGGVLLAAIGFARIHGASAAAVGAVVAASGLGAMLGAAVSARPARRFGAGQIVGATLAVMAVLVPLMGLSPHPVVLGAVIAGCSFLAPVMTTVVVTVQTAVTPDELQARVQTAMSFAATCMSPLGPIIAGAALSGMGAPCTFLLFDAALVVLLGVGLSSRGLRHVERARTPV